MPSIITTAHLPTKSKEARDELIKLFADITEYSRANEPGVLRYITCVPTDPSNETSVYMIEEYESQAASDAHLQIPPVKALLAHFGATDPFAGPVHVHSLSPAHFYQRPGTVSATPSTLIILAHFGYLPGRTTNALEGWKGIVDNSEANEPPTLAYAVMEDGEKNTVRTVEVYENAEFASEVHVKSEAVRRNQEQNGADRSGEKGVVKLRVVQGFLGRK